MFADEEWAYVIRRGDSSGLHGSFVMFDLISGQCVPVDIPHAGYAPIESTEGLFYWRTERETSTSDLLALHHFLPDRGSSHKLLEVEIRKDGFLYNGIQDWHNYLRVYTPSADHVYVSQSLRVLTPEGNWVPQDERFCNYLIETASGSHSRLRGLAESIDDAHSFVLGEKVLHALLLNRTHPISKEDLRKMAKRGFSVCRPKARIIVLDGPSLSPETATLVDEAANDAALGQTASIGGTLYYTKMKWDGQWEVRSFDPVSGRHQSRAILGESDLPKGEVSPTLLSIDDAPYSLRRLPWKYKLEALAEDRVDILYPKAWGEFIALSAGMLVTLNPRAKRPRFLVRDPNARQLVLGAEDYLFDGREPICFV